VPPGLPARRMPPQERAFRTVDRTFLLPQRSAQDLFRILHKTYLFSSLLRETTEMTPPKTLIQHFTSKLSADYYIIRERRAAVKKVRGGEKREKISTCKKYGFS
jgi:hypothetical protein